jgi:hypothetical protein
MVISLFVETQREAIISGKEELSLDLFEQVFKNNFSNIGHFSSYFFMP